MPHIASLMRLQAETPRGLEHIRYGPLLAPTRAQRAWEVLGERFRIVHPIVRLDEDQNVYDVTRAFIEEALFFPSAPHGDLIDASSRIYDMQPCAASQWQRAEWEPPVYPDA
jgi:hypothetical protein